MNTENNNDKEKIIVIPFWPLAIMAILAGLIVSNFLIETYGGLRSNVMDGVVIWLNAGSVFAFWLMFRSGEYLISRLLCLVYIVLMAALAVVRFGA